MCFRPSFASWPAYSRSTCRLAKDARRFAVLEARRASRRARDRLASTTAYELVGRIGRVLAHLEEQTRHGLIAHRRIREPRFVDERLEPIEKSLANDGAVGLGARARAVARDEERFTPLVRPTENDFFGLRRTRRLGEDSLLERHRARLASRWARASIAAPWRVPTARCR